VFEWLMIESVEDEGPVTITVPEEME